MCYFDQSWHQYEPIQTNKILVIGNISAILYCQYWVKNKNNQLYVALYYNKALLLYRKSFLLNKKIKKILLYN